MGKMNWMVFDVRVFRTDGTIGRHTVAAPDDVRAREAAVLLDEQDAQAGDLAPVWYCTIEMIAEVENSETFAE